jgi:hypothetical protein
LSQHRGRLPLCRDGGGDHAARDAADGAGGNRAAQRGVPRRQCRIVNARRLGGARNCALKGFVAPKLPAVSHADLAADVHVRVGTRPEHPGPKVERRKGAPPLLAQRLVTVTFRARRAANARSFYTVSTRMLHGSKGRSFGTMGPIAKDVVVGRVLGQKLYFPGLDGVALGGESFPQGVGWSGHTSTTPWATAHGVAETSSAASWALSASMTAKPAIGKSERRNGPWVVRTPAPS